MNHDVDAIAEPTMLSSDFDFENLRMLRIAAYMNVAVCSTCTVTLWRARAPPVEKTGRNGHEPSLRDNNVWDSSADGMSAVLTCGG